MATPNRFGVTRSDSIVLQGYFKKLKTMKKKYFALFADSNDKPARLEYYDTEKKFRARFGNPKRNIVLKSCFHISRRMDTKHKLVISLYTKDDCFSVVYDTEADMKKWLKALLDLHAAEEAEGDKPRTSFEHVWQVQVQRKGLAEERGIIGNYHLCLNDKSLTLVRTGPPMTLTGEARMANVEFLLTTIRRCGDSQCYFYMEVGRFSALGAGELWMGTEDPLIAQNMHTTIINAMSAIVKQRDDFDPIQRTRSSSANEASKPNLMAQRRLTHVGSTKPIVFSPSGSAIGRERCDSLPTRNRTTSETIQSNLSMPPPPPRMPVGGMNRPHSMYNRHSNSPPLNVGPLSPSAGCSESDGSSLSIDETDGYSNSITPDEGHNFGSRYYNSRTTSGSVILEENPDDFWFNDNNKRSLPYIDKTPNGSLSLPITQSGQVNGPRKGSPAPPHAYMEMYSPSGSSPGDHQVGTGYMMMSPGLEYGRSIYTNSSGAHSRASSLAEETNDGYVPSDPPQQGYMDMMDPSQRQHATSGMSSAASSCSITSGTPSTDLRFAEYQLDKVVSRFTPDEEDTSLNAERPTRAYSVGSRLEHNKRKLRVDLLAAEHNNSRVRAFSVGSRAKVPRSELYRGVIQTAPLSTILNKDVAANLTNNNNVHHNSSTNILSTSSGSTKSSDATAGHKFASAPLLLNKGPGSIDPMDDLMEIDYTVNASMRVDDPENASPPKSASHQYSSSLLSSSASTTVKSVSQPMSVPPAKKQDENSVPSYGGRVELPSGYVPMKPTMNSAAFPPVYTEYGYMEMKPINAGNSGGNVSKLGRSTSSLAISPTKSSSFTSPKTHIGITGLRNNNYMDMTPRSMHVDQPPPPMGTVNASPQSSSDDYLNMSPSSRSGRVSGIGAGGGGSGSMGGGMGRGNSDKPMDVDMEQKPLSAPEGYMEMYWGQKSKAGDTNSNNRSGRNNNNNNVNNNNNNNDPLNTRIPDEYINMDFGRNNSMNYNNDSQRLSSLPININVSRFQQNNRKNMVGNLTLVSTTTPSNPIQKVPRVRCDSKDSGIVTPSGSHPSIFPFSPGSPGKQFTSQNQLDENTLPRKCLVDGTTGTLRLSEEEDSNNSQRSTPSTPDPGKIMNTDPMLMDTTPPSKPIAVVRSIQFGRPPQLDVLSNDYADMTLGGSTPTTNAKSKIKTPATARHPDSMSDYVNCTPSLATLSKPITRTSSVPSNDLAGDYAVMNPAALMRTISAPATDGPQTAPISTTKKSILVTLNNNPDKVHANAVTKTNLSGFKPITSNTDEFLMQTGTTTTSPRPILATAFNRQLSERRCNPITTSDSSTMSAYEFLHSGTGSIPTPSYSTNRLLHRPNSVNSDKISNKNVLGASGSNSSSGGLGGNPTRPNSANSDRLTSISTSSSTSTLCGGSSSSSSTLCGGGSKSQSPLSAIVSTGSVGGRPQSYSEDIIMSSVNTPTIPSSRPPSVSCERELHYASLDLPPASSAGPIINRLEVDINLAAAVTAAVTITTKATASGTSTATSKSNSLSGDSSASPSPSGSGGSGSGGVVCVSGGAICNSDAQCETPTFTYAQIDFIKSENLNKMNAVPSANVQQGQTQQQPQPQ